MKRIPLPILSILLLVLVVLGIHAAAASPAPTPAVAPASAVGGMQPGELHCPVVANIAGHRFDLIPDVPMNWVHIDKVQIPDGFGGYLLGYYRLTSETADGESYQYNFDSLNALARIRELEIQ